MVSTEDFHFWLFFFSNTVGINITEGPTLAKTWRFHSTLSFHTTPGKGVCPNQPSFLPVPAPAPKNWHADPDKAETAVSTTTQNLLCGTLSMLTPQQNQLWNDTATPSWQETLGINISLLRKNASSSSFFVCCWDLTFATRNVLTYNQSDACAMLRDARFCNHPPHSYPHPPPLPQKRGEQWLCLLLKGR